MSLPTSREFITQLLQSLPDSQPIGLHDDASASNTLQAAPESVKRQLLTLHVLFPNELLPALDLLDRRLVMRFRIRDHLDEDTDEEMLDWNAPISEPAFTSSNAPKEEEEEEEHTPQAPTTTEDAKEKDRDKDTVYYVRSAQQQQQQQRSSRFSASYDSTTTYEVRLLAWNCSCPAFAFAAFPAVYSDPSTRDEGDEGGGKEGRRGVTGRGRNGEWCFGGLSLGSATPPVCKHLLACVLVERCRLFGGLVEEKLVNVDEAAGWAAGWGD
ncbi:hypothetical protein K504DRAFT_245115 [Pleomassaria siparia CBS 279.74]|uniref:SWIM-type domain-containing protein n=1 Tax=Pleomassaria siparia CBS 279.74 TaxID=1314801 RepID=A0A6G1KEG3_9PLEO|nr:hypothetical protein K504DRAFT_245115 [Pleomassaria siparia CBS 279.74]